MFYFPPVIVLRHRRENLKKCSLRGLEGRSDFRFLAYPTDPIPNLDGYCLLTLDKECPLLSSNDSNFGLFVIDATWRRAAKIERVAITFPMVRRRLPDDIKTAYPRRQLDCPYPLRGLASIEAIYVAYLILKRPVENLLDKYLWKEDFQLNIAQSSSML